MYEGEPHVFGRERLNLEKDIETLVRDVKDGDRVGYFETGPERADMVEKWINPFFMLELRKHPAFQAMPILDTSKVKLYKGLDEKKPWKKVRLEGKDSDGSPFAAEISLVMGDLPRFTKGVDQPKIADALLMGIVRGLLQKVTV